MSFNVRACSGRQQRIATPIGTKLPHARHNHRAGAGSSNPAAVPDTNLYDAGNGHLGAQTAAHPPVPPSAPSCVRCGQNILWRSSTHTTYRQCHPHIPPTSPISGLH